MEDSLNITTQGNLNTSLVKNKSNQNCINSIIHLACNAFKANSLIIAFMSALLLEFQSISYFKWVLKSMYTAFPQDRLLTYILIFLFA